MVAEYQARWGKRQAAMSRLAFATLRPPARRKRAVKNDSENSREDIIEERNRLMRLGVPLVPRRAHESEGGYENMREATITRERVGSTKPGPPLAHRRQAARRGFGWTMMNQLAFATLRKARRP